MSGSLTRGDGETFPAFPAHAQPAILGIWQEANATVKCMLMQVSNEQENFFSQDTAKHARARAQTNTYMRFL